MKIKKIYKKLSRYLYDKWVINSEIRLIFYNLRLWYFRNFKSFNKEYSYFNSEYNLIFLDNFEGTKLNRSVWKGGQNWGRVHPTHPEQYSGREGIKVEDGTIQFFNKYLPQIITEYKGTEHERTYYPEKGECLYVHGDISMKEKLKTFNYGVFEIRCKIPKGVIGWPAFWLGMDGKEEIDFFEFFPKNVNDKSVSMTTTVHWPDGTGLDYPQGGSMSAKKHKLPNDITENYHTYTFEWTPDKIVFMFDGLVIRKITRKSIIKRYRQKFGRLNIGTGIYFDSLPEVPGTILKETFYVDYVAVFQKGLGIDKGYKIG